MFSDKPFTVSYITPIRAAVTVLVALVTLLSVTAPMNDLPLWNGDRAGHRNQYELMAEALLDGKIYIDYGDTEGLEALENPYDPDERKESGVAYHWDHAYYNGHYYMYFGIVPVLLVFLPYRMITGTPLTTFHATQLFCAIAIIGIFALFYKLAKLFFGKMSWTVYLSFSAAFSVMSVWYASAEPALYCTAISSAIALEVWSIYFFIWAVWGEKRENIQILLAAIGALLGALVFGCRPTVALANILVLPMLAVFIRQRKFTLKLLGKLTLAALPYVAVGAALMLYNYVRFENPFEFGQRYQLTVADQSNYSIALNGETLIHLFDDGIKNFFGTKQIKADFPYLQTSSVFFNFPILFLGVCMFAKPVYKKLCEYKLLPLMYGFCAAPAVICAFQILWTPYLLERYRMDMYFLVGIFCFIAVGVWYELSKKRRVLGTVLVALCAVTVVCSFLYYVRTVGVYYPDEVTRIAQQFGIY